MNITIFGKTLVVNIKGDVDHHCAADIREKIDESFIRQNAENILLNFEGAEFMDSSGLGMIMGRYKLAAACGGELAISGLNAQTEKLLELSGITRIADVYKTVDEAIRALEGATKNGLA